MCKEHRKIFVRHKYILKLILGWDRVVHNYPQMKAVRKTRGDPISLLPLILRAKNTKETTTDKHF